MATQLEYAVGGDDFNKFSNRSGCPYIWKGYGSDIGEAMRGGENPQERGWQFPDAVWLHFLLVRQQPTLRRVSSRWTIENCEPSRHRRQLWKHSLAHQGAESLFWARSRDYVWEKGVLEPPLYPSRKSQSTNIQCKLILFERQERTQRQRHAAILGRM